MTWSLCHVSSLIVRCLPTFAFSSCFQQVFPILLHMRLLSVDGLLSGSFNVMKKLQNLDCGSHRSSSHFIYCQGWNSSSSCFDPQRLWRSDSHWHVIDTHQHHYLKPHHFLMHLTKALDFNLAIRYTGSICQHPSDRILRHGLAFGECGHRHPSQQQGTLAKRDFAQRGPCR